MWLGVVGLLSLTMPNHVPEYIADTLNILAGGLALALGGRPERWTGAALIGEIFCDAVLQRRGVRHLNEPMYAVLGIDVALLVFLGVLLYLHQRRWLIYATCFQLLSVVAHLSRFYDPTVGSWGYRSLAVGCGYAVIAALVWGVLRPSTDGSVADAARG